MNRKIIEDIKKYKQKNYKSIGIIRKTSHETREVYSFLKANDIDSKHIKQDDEYTNGVIVIPSYPAK